MTVFMRKSIGEEKLLEIRASSKHGNGVFYITSMAVIYEVDDKGIYLNFLPQSTIKKFVPVGHALFGARKFRITWIEDAERIFEFRTRQHKQLQTMLESKSMSCHT